MAMAQDIDPFKLSSPRIFLVWMVVFLTLFALIVIVLYKQIWAAFLANPALNTVIIFVLAVGIARAFWLVIRLFPEIDWVNGFRLADPGLAVERAPVLLAPMAALLRDRIGRMAISAQMMRGILDSIATRLDEARDTSRYMTGLLVFLGLLGTFWGLIETMGSIGSVINSLKPGGDAGAIFESLKEGLAAPLGGIGIAFSASCLDLRARSCSAFSTCRPARRRTASILNSRIGSPPPCAISASAGTQPRPHRARSRAICASPSSDCGRQSPRADRAGPPRPPWPISRKRFRGWCTTCAASNR